MPGFMRLGQCARFVTTNPMPAQKFVPALNRVLDKAVRVLDSREVDEEFHPRFSAKSRVYRYWIENAPVPNPLLRHRRAHRQAAERRRDAKRGKCVYRRAGFCSVAIGG